MMIAGMKSAKYYERSIRDYLTGAYVKSILKHNMDTMISSAKRYKRNFSVLMADIDFFKNINDKYGHLAGDFVLKSIGEIIREIVRESDMFFRYGGEEFVILMPETNAENAKIVADRIKNAVENKVFLYTKGMDEAIFVTISIGGYEYIQGEKESDYFDIIEIVDEALYEAKETGRNRVVFSNGLKKV